MVQSLQIPNQRVVKIAAEQSTGAETCLLTDSDGHLQVDVLTLTGGSTDDSAAPTTPGLVCGRYDAAPTTRDDGDAVTLQTDATGSLRVVDANTATDDAAAPTVGPLVMAKFGASSGDANDSVPVRCDATGSLVVNDLNAATDDAAAPTTGPLSMFKFGASSPDANDACPAQCDATGALLVTTDAHSAACGTKTVVAGGYASTVAPAAVTDADAARVWVDARGRVNVRECYSYAQGSGDFQVSANPCYVKRVILSATGAGVFTLYDNAAEAGTAVLKFYMAANTTAIIPLEFICATACYAGKDGAWAGEVTVVYEDLA